MRSMRSKIVRALTVVISIIALTITGLIVTTSPAVASAQNCDYWGGFDIEVEGIPVSVPSGKYCFSITGDGLKIKKTHGAYTSNWLSNVTETVHFYDNWENNYKSFRTYRTTGRQIMFQSWDTKINGTAKPGRVCGELRTNGVKVAEACNGIW